MEELLPTNQERTTACASRFLYNTLENNRISQMFFSDCMVQFRWQLESQKHYENKLI